jgi:hypothetical protein
MDNKQTRKAQWQKAAKDPLFLKDIAEIEREFLYADAESLPAFEERKDEPLISYEKMLMEDGLI